MSVIHVEVVGDANLSSELSGSHRQGVQAVFQNLMGGFTET